MISSVFVTAGQSLLSTIRSHLLVSFGFVPIVNMLCGRQTLTCEECPVFEELSMRVLPFFSAFVHTSSIFYFDGPQ